MRLGDFGGNRLQAGLVAIRQRKVAAAACEFERQRAADAAGRAGDRGGRSSYCGHQVSPRLMDHVEMPVP
jgi:hypothetical protein